jgi:hypothetical protein
MLLVAEAADGVLDPFKQATEALLVFLDDTIAVAGKLVHDLSRHNNVDLSSLRKVLYISKCDLLTMVLGEV